MGEGMVEAEYWKLKAKMLEFAIEENRFRIALKDIADRRNALAKEHGFRTDVPYKFNDETLEVEEMNG